jgi:hypothetical protein
MSWHGSPVLTDQNSSGIRRYPQHFGIAQTFQTSIGGGSDVDLWRYPA